MLTPSKNQSQIQLKTKCSRSYCPWKMEGNLNSESNLSHCGSRFIKPLTSLPLWKLNNSFLHLDTMNTTLHWKKNMKAGNFITPSKSLRGWALNLWIILKKVPKTIHQTTKSFKTPMEPSAKLIPKSLLFLQECLSKRWKNVLNLDQEKDSLP